LTESQDVANSNVYGTKPDDGAPNRGVIPILLLSAVIVVLNETVMSVALPHVMTDLHVAASTGQWLTTAYMLTMAVLIPTSGWVLRRLSTRTVFALAMAIFSLGTLLAGLAPTFGVLMTARVVQAIGASMMGPLLMACVLELTPEHRRGRSLGTVTIVIAVAPAIGPVLSGVVLQFLPWRALFLVVLPIAISALIVGLIRLVNVGSTAACRLDVLSLVLTLPAFGLLVLGLNQLGVSGTSGMPVVGIVAFALGAGSLVWFILRQLRLRSSGTPLMDLRILRFAPFRSSTTVLLLAMTVNFGVLLIVPLYLQRVRGLDPLVTGLVMLGGGVLSGVMGRVSGWLCDHYNPKMITLIGTTILTASVVSFAFSDAHTPVWRLVLQYALMMGGGNGLITTPSLTNATASLPAALNSHGIAFISTFQQVVGAAGGAGLVTVLAIVGGPNPARSGEAAGLSAAFLTAAAVALAALIMTFLVVRIPAAPAVLPEVHAGRATADRSHPW
jgi:MFS transporter, DHA2 family, lincomycin resistance protein